MERGFNAPMKGFHIQALLDVTYGGHMTSTLQGKKVHSIWKEEEKEMEYFLQVVKK